MYSRVGLRLVALILLATVQCVKSEVTISEPVAEMARQAALDVASVGRISPGSKGAPVFVLEERHDSRMGQIEQAISLVRLYRENSLRDIVLEGYLKDEPRLRRTSFRKEGRESLLLAKVALPLLSEGNISSAEFMALVFDDIRLHPAEQAPEYRVELIPEARSVPVQLLFRIALKPEHLPQIQSLGKLPEGEERSEKIQELLDHVISSDPWTKSAYVDYTQVLEGDSSTRESCNITRKIKDRAAQIDVPANEVEAIESAVAFWCGRSAADATMFQTVVELTAPGAMMVGAAHTAEITDLLANSGRPFAVITPQSLWNEDTSKFSGEEWQRKEGKRSLHPLEILRSVLDSPSSAEKKPGPVLNEPWLEADAELRFLTDELVQSVFGGGKEPPRDPPVESGLPEEFPERNLQTRFVTIKPESVRVVHADEEDRKGQAVLFEALVFSRSIWVKAARTNEELGAALEGQSLESRVEEMLTEVRSGLLESIEESNPSTFRMTLDIVAAVTESETKARETVLKS